MLGMIPMLLLIAAAVSIFVAVSARGGQFACLEKQSLDTAYGVAGMVRVRKSGYESEHVQELIVGIALCVLAVIPVLIGSILGGGGERRWHSMAEITGVCVLLAFAAAGVFLIVRTSIRWGAYETLLEEGDHSRKEKQRTREKEGISRIFWPVVTAGYLLVSFLTGRWDLTWVVWPVAAILYGIF